MRLNSQSVQRTLALQIHSGADKVQHEYREARDTTGSHHGIPDPPGAVLDCRSGWLAEMDHVRIRVEIDIVHLTVILVRHDCDVRLIPGAVTLPIGVRVVVVVLYIAVVVAA